MNAQSTSKRDKAVHTLIPTTLIDAVDEIARRIGTSRSDVVRFALNDYVDQHCPRSETANSGATAVHPYSRPLATIRRTSGKIV